MHSNERGLSREHAHWCFNFRGISMKLNCLLHANTHARTHIIYIMFCVTFGHFTCKKLMLLARYCHVRYVVLSGLTAIVPVQLMLGSLATSPMELAKDYIAKYHQHYSGGVYWVSGWCRELISSAVESITQVNKTTSLSPH